MGFVAAIVSAVLWGLELVVLEMVLDRGVAWPVAGFYTYAVSALFVLAYGASRGKVRLGQLKAAWPWLLAIGVVGSTINVTAIKGIQLSDSTSAAIIQRTQILFAMILGWLALKERVRLGDVPAAIAMAVGFLVIQFAGAAPDAEGARQALAPGSGTWIAGNLLFLSSAFFLAVNATLIKRTSRFTNREFIALVNMGFITCSMAFLCGAGGGSVTAAWKAECRGLLLALGFLAGASVLLYYFAISQIEIWKLSALQLLIPVTTATVRRVVLRRNVSPGQLAGMVLIMAGATALILLHQRRKVGQAREA